MARLREMRGDTLERHGDRKQAKTRMISKQRGLRSGCDDGRREVSYPEGDSTGHCQAAERTNSA